MKKKEGKNLMYLTVQIDAPNSEICAAMTNSLVRIENSGRLFGEETFSGSDLAIAIMNSRPLTAVAVPIPQQLNRCRFERKHFCLLR